MTTEVAELIPSITTIYGDPGTIKTSIAITWPRPMAVYNLEGGASRAWGYNEGIADKSIVERKFAIPVKSLTERWAALTGHLEAWKAMTKQMETDFKTFKTVVWDTGTMVWALDRDAYLQELQQEKARKQLLQIEYGEPNRRMNGLYSLPRAYQTHLVVVHHETDEYAQVFDPMGRPMVEDGRPMSATTGKRIPEGFKHTLALSDWVLHTHIETNPDTNEDTPWATVEKSGYGLYMRGKSMEWPSYEGLAVMVNDKPKNNSDKFEAGVEADN